MLLRSDVFFSLLQFCFFFRFVIFAWLAQHEADGGKKGTKLLGHFVGKKGVI